MGHRLIIVRGAWFLWDYLLLFVGVRYILLCRNCFLFRVLNKRCAQIGRGAGVAGSVECFLRIWVCCLLFWEIGQVIGASASYGYFGVGWALLWLVVALLKACWCWGWSELDLNISLILFIGFSGCGCLVVAIVVIYFWVFFSWWLMVLSQPFLSRPNADEFGQPETLDPRFEYCRIRNSGWLSKKLHQGYYKISLQ